MKYSVILALILPVVALCAAAVESFSQAPAAKAALLRGSRGGALPAACLDVSAATLSQIYRPDGALYTQATCAGGDGWVLVLESLGFDDAPIVGLGRGPGPSSRGHRVVMVDALVFIVVDAGGTIVDLDPPAEGLRGVRIGAAARLAPGLAAASWTARAGASFRARAEAARPRSGRVAVGGSLRVLNDTALADYVPEWRQLKPREHENKHKCASGCGATAWMMLLGWSSSAGRQNVTCPDGTTPLDGLQSMSPSPTPCQGEMTMEIRSALSSFCAPGEQTATIPNTMASGFRTWTQEHALPSSPDELLIKFNAFGVSQQRIVDLVDRCIAVEESPAVIGEGFLAHYPMAKATWIDDSDGTLYWYVNKGWGSKTSNMWQPRTSWFAGCFKKA